MLVSLLTHLGDQVSIGVVAPRVLPAVDRVPLCEGLAMPGTEGLRLLRDAGQPTPGR